MNVASLTQPMRLHPSLALLFGAASIATAQAGQTPPDTARMLKPVTITEARTAAEVGGAAAVVIKPEALRSSPAPLLYEALRESPFIHVRQNSRGEMELSVRGSDSRQAAVFLNGVPLTLGWDHRTDPSLIPVTGTESITIVRGLGSVLNGPNVLGGMIDIRHGSQSATGRQVWGGAGLDENMATVTTIGGGAKIGDAMNGALSIGGGLGHRKRDGYRLPSGAVDATVSDGLRTNSDLEEIDGFAMLRWNGARGRNVGLTVSGFNAERGVPPEEEISGPRLWRYPYHTRTVTSLSANTGFVTTPFGSGSLEVSAGYNSGRLKIENYTDRTYTTVDAEELGDERTMTTRALATHTLPMDAILKLALTTASIRYTETVSPDTGVHYRQQMMSFGGEVDAPLGAKTMLSLGLVLDQTKTPETGGRTPGQEPFDALGWRGGLSYDATRTVRLHASASQRSRFPALRELYSGALNRFRPNPDLKPETLLGFEAGFTVDRPLGAIPQAKLQMTGFRHNLDDAVVRITLPSPTRFMRINRDRIQSTGAEILAGLVFGENADRSVSLTGDATIQRIKIFDDSASGALRHPEDNPEMRGMLELGVPLPAQLRGFANARYLGKQYCLNPDTGNEDTLKGQTATDLALERKFNVSGRGLIRSLRALVSVDNVGNAALFDSCGLPRAGRTLRVMFSFH